MKLFSRTAIAGLVSAGALFLVVVPINWSGIRWGTAPEWVGALALLSIAAAVWMMARSSGQQQRTDRGRRVDLER